MKLLKYTLLAFVMLLMSCEVAKVKTSGKLQLRQLNKSTDTVKYSQASFFLITGSMTSSEYKLNTIKMYVLADSNYNYVEYPVEKVKIRIDNNITIPYLIISTNNVHKEASDTYMLDMTQRYHYDNDNIIVLVCPEQCLPEQLLPINL